MPVTGLEPAVLCRHCDPQSLDFATTADVETSAEFIGQQGDIDGFSEPGSGWPHQQ
jgi:hypothetical protein